jgi:alkanesulfonate monooxygenase SsuD/methylene tetrahydromethanopterin reductase-like flavin-dependent oxidoreductase (luciferase family)
LAHALTVLRFSASFTGDELAALLVGWHSMTTERIADHVKFAYWVPNVSNSTSDKRGMWADSTFDDLVQYNDGFRTQLIGTPEQIAERVAAYRKRGVDLILGGFLHFQEEIEYFGSRVLPLVREIEDSEQDSVDSPVLVSA